MRVIGFYIDADRYRDRVLMLQHVATAVGHVYLYTASPPKDPALTACPAMTVIPLDGAPTRRIETMRALRLAILAHLDREPIDLIHDTANYMLPLFAQLRRRRLRPRLLTSSFTASHTWWRGLRHTHPYRLPVYLRRRYQGHAEEWLMARLVDGMTVFGEGHRAPTAGIYGLPVERVFSVANCAAPDRFKPHRPDPSSHGFEPDAQVLLFAGNIFRYKGIYELLDAFAGVVQRYPKARLLAIGDIHHVERAPIAARIAELGIADKVRLPGVLPRGELPALLASVMAMVLPSYLEGSPRVVMEAMACGRPVVATRMPGITALDPEGVCIDFVEPANAASLYAGLMRLFAATPEANDARGQRGRMRYLASHTPVAAADTLVGVYRELL